MPQRPLQRRLHLHVLELADGEVEVLDDLGMLVGVVVEEQLGEAETGEAISGRKRIFSQTSSACA